MFYRLCMPVASSRHVYIPLTCFPSVLDSDHVLTSNVNVLLLHTAAIPHTIVTIADNRIFLPVLNFGLCKQVIPKCILLDNASPIKNTAISVLDVLTSSAATCSSATSNPGIFSEMIAQTCLPNRLWIFVASWILIATSLTLRIACWDRLPL